MKVFGADIQDAAVAELALLLHASEQDDLAQRIGTAIDTNQRQLRLSVEDIPIALGVLTSPSNELTQLRDALLAEREKGPRRWRLSWPTLPPTKG